MPEAISNSGINKVLRGYYKTQLGTLVTACAEKDGALEVSSKVLKSARWNHTAWLGDPGSSFDAYLRTGRRNPIYLSEAAIDTGTRNLLGEAGYEAFEAEAWLEWQPTNRTPVAFESNARITELDERSLPDFLELLTELFQATDTTLPESLQDFSSREGSKARYFICFDSDGNKAGVGSIGADGEIGCVIHLALLSKVSKEDQGQLAALLLKKISDRQPVFMQVTGTKICAETFEALGFRQQFTRSGYRLRREEGAIIGSALDEVNATASHFGVSIETVLIGAWAYLINKYSGGETASFLVQRKDELATRLQIAIDGSEDFSTWLKKIDAGHEVSECGKLDETLASSIIDFSGNANSGTYSAVVSIAGGKVEVTSAKLDSGTIQRLSEQLAEAIRSFPRAKNVEQIEILPKNERETVLKQFNQTELRYARKRGIHCLIEDQAKISSETVALITEKEKLTYGELNSRANRLAHYLRKNGAKPDSLVAICSERTADLVIAMLAVVKSGGAYVPIDPAYPKDRIKFIIEDANAPIVLTQEHLAGQLPQTNAQVVLLGKLDTAEFSSDNPPCNVDDNNLAYVIFTSGSTGRPKGVAIEHRSVVAFAEWSKTVFSKEDLDGVLFATSVCFDLSIYEVFVTLALGGKMVLAETALHLPGHPAANEVKLINTVPSAIAELARMKAIPASVKIINLAGEPLKQALVEELYSIPTVEKVYDLYGPTEDTVYSTFTLRAKGGKATIGRPIANTRAYILDAKLNPLPIGVPGELHLAGAGLARGYLNRAELTAEKFIPDPFYPGEKMYKTGDLTRFLPDGQIEYLGRIDHQVKVRGYRIELGEIENAIRSHQAVLETAVMARNEQNGEKKIVAYVVGDPDWQAKKTTEAEQSQVSGWEVVFDAAYSHETSTSDTEFNLASWNSSYDGKPIPEEQMREWRDQTVERILDLKPKRVLEIGCGTGLLLFKIAPRCESYMGTDISGKVLNDLAKRVGHLPQVKLAQKKADELSGLEKGAFDTIIINSVIQYFPSTAYLVKVLEEAAQLLADGGKIFVGDPRNYKLLNAFCCDVELGNAADELSTTELKKKMDQRVMEEKELLVDPQFFISLPESIRDITSVEVMPKAAKHRNEMSCFRYDAVLYKGKTEAELNPSWKDWGKSRLSTLSLKELLTTSNGPVGIKNIPNKRIARAVQAFEATGNSEFANAGEIKNQIKEIGVSPDELIEIGNQAGYKTYLTWAGCNETGNYHAVFDKDREARKFVNTSALVNTARQRLSALGNNPLKKNFQSELLPELKQIISTKLPEYMMPSAFVFLDALPLTPNGKLNRKALPDPTYTVGGQSGPIKDPQNPLELQLKLVFEKFLNRRPIGTDVSFFELGGDSLQALSLIVEIERFTGRKIPLSILYNSPTVEALAKSIEKEAGALEKKALVPLQPLGTKKPLFLVHTNPGDVLGYGNLVYHLGHDQPCYGFQSLGLLKEEWRQTSIEEMAARYVMEMRELQPNGPYVLGGWCYGGIVAAEMAQQLVKAGQKVALLALFETPAPAPPLSHYVYYLNRFSRLFRMKSSRLKQYFGEKLKYYRGLKTTNAMRFKRVDKCETGSAEEIAQKNQLLAKLELIYNTNSAALAKYKGKFYPGKVVLFNAVQQDPACVDDPNYGWTGMAAEIETHILPGDHDSILAEPNIGELAAKLKEHLEAVQTA